MLRDVVLLHGIGTHKRASYARPKARAGSELERSSFFQLVSPLVSSMCRGRKKTVEPVVEPIVHHGALNIPSAIAGTCPLLIVHGMCSLHSLSLTSSNLPCLQPRSYSLAWRPFLPYPSRLPFVSPSPCRLPFLPPYSHRHVVVCSESCSQSSRGKQ